MAIIPPITLGNRATTTTTSGVTSLTAVTGTISAQPVAVSAVATRELKDHNVVVVLLDDVGLEKFVRYASITGAPITSTYCKVPNIKTHVMDRGISFTQFWVCPQCGPTRATAETELYPHHHGQFTNILSDPLNPLGGNFYLGQDPLDINNRAKQLYQTLPHAIRNGRPKGLYKLGKIGKSHLQQNDYYAWPAGGEGWSIFKGHMQNLVSHQDWEYVVATRDLETGEATYTISNLVGQFGPEVELADMIAFVNDAAADDAPFVLWWCPSVGHSEYSSPGTTRISVGSQNEWIAAFGGSYPPLGTDFDFINSVDPTERAKRIMCQKHQIEHVDDVFGDLVAQLQANDQYDNTVFMVFCDNGTSPDVIEAPFAEDHGKRKVYAGGVNVPLFISGPVVAPRTSPTSAELVNAADIGATIRDICKVYTAASDADVAAGARERDGVSFLGHLRDPAIKSPRTINFTMAGGPYVGYGYNPVTRIYTGTTTQSSYTVSDGTHTLLRLSGAPPIEKLFLASNWLQTDATNLLVTSPSDPTVIAALTKLRAELNTILTT